MEFLIILYLFNDKLFQCLGNQFERKTVTESSFLATQFLIGIFFKWDTATEKVPVTVGTVNTA